LKDAAEIFMKNENAILQTPKEGFNSI